MIFVVGLLSLENQIDDEKKFVPFILNNNIHINGRSVYPCFFMIGEIPKKNV